MKKILVKIKNISKKYNDVLVIKNFNLDIEKGSFITLLGPSGCGKTTLLKMIAGFENPDSGKILVNDIDIKDLDIQRRTSVTVFQDYALFPNMNVEQNIAYGLKLIRKPIDNLSKDIYKEVDKKINEYEKKSKIKIKLIDKQQNNIKKDIKKIKNKINSNILLSNLYNLSDDEFSNKIEEIYEKFRLNFKKDIYKSIPFKIKFFEIVNSLLWNLGSEKFIKYNSKIDIKKEEQEIIIEFLKNKKYFRYVSILKERIFTLEEKYNNLDYWISYWQNYPSQEREWLEKKLLTRKISKDEIKEEVNSVINLVSLDGKNKLMPSNLSGGMQQRVALARAVVIKPEILLLDEPLSALDAKVRKQMQMEIKRFHKELGITFILVTHDQEEALVLSDKIVVINKGEVMQVGTPQDIYDKPKNIWVANFIGQANIFEGEIVGKQKIKINDFIFDISSEYKYIKIGSKVNIMIRPEDFDLVEKSKSKISVKIKSITYKGLLWEVKCFWNNKPMNIECINKVEINKIVHLNWDIEDMHIMKVNYENN